MNASFVEPKKIAKCELNNKFNLGLSSSNTSSNNTTVVFIYFFHLSILLGISTSFFLAQTHDCIINVILNLCSIFLFEFFLKFYLFCFFYISKMDYITLNPGLHLRIA